MDVPFDKDFMEDVLNWTLPGSAFFYRDTDLPLAGELIYRKGDIIRAGFFIDVSPIAQRPVMNTRFVIASAHAAPVWAVEPGGKSLTWKLTVLHYNSYFRVMDVYKVGEQTQVFLFHIPYKSIPLFRDIDFDFDLTSDSNPEGILSPVELARKSFDEKLKMDPLAEFEDEEWIDRTRDPIGMGENGWFSLDFHYADNPGIMDLGDAIRQLADDMDEINYP